MMMVVQAGGAGGGGGGLRKWGLFRDLPKRGQLARDTDRDMKLLAFFSVVMAQCK